MKLWQFSIEFKENNECVYLWGWNDDKSQDDMNKWEYRKDN